MDTSTITTTNAIAGDWKPDGYFNSTPYFNTDSETFYNCVKGKKKNKHWKTFIKQSTGEKIQKWAAKNRNKSFLLRNVSDDSYIYAHRVA